MLEMPSDKFMEDWLENPHVQFAGTEQCSSDWKKLKEEDIKTLVANYVDYHQVKKANVDETAILLVIMLFRIHCDVERLHPDAFPTRSLHKTPQQLDEMRMWLWVNFEHQLPKLKLTEPQEEYDHEPVGLLSNHLKDDQAKEKAYLIAKGVLKGPEHTVSSGTSEWLEVPARCKKLLTNAIRAVWKKKLLPEPNSGIQTHKQMWNGFLRIHMDVERQPFETFYPRFYSTDPTDWTKILTELKDHCAPSALANKGAGGGN